MRHCVWSVGIQSKPPHASHLFHDSTFKMYSRIGHFYSMKWSPTRETVNRWAVREVLRLESHRNVSSPRSQLPTLNRVLARPLFLKNPNILSNAKAIWIFGASGEIVAPQNTVQFSTFHHLIWYFKIKTLNKWRVSFVWSHHGRLQYWQPHINFIAMKMAIPCSASNIRSEVN